MMSNFRGGYHSEFFKTLSTWHEDNRRTFITQNNIIITLICFFKFSTVTCCIARLQEMQCDYINAFGKALHPTLVIYIYHCLHCVRWTKLEDTHMDLLKQKQTTIVMFCIKIMPPTWAL